VFLGFGLCFEKEACAFLVLVWVPQFMVLDYSPQACGGVGYSFRGSSALTRGIFSKVVAFFSGRFYPLGCVRVHLQDVALKALKGWAIPSRAFANLVRGEPEEENRVLCTSCFGPIAGIAPEPLPMGKG
jgi:hypothetical protein